MPSDTARDAKLKKIELIYDTTKAIHWRGIESSR